MSVNIRFPSITAKTQEEQIRQIKSYLHQLVSQLNWVLSNSNMEPGSVTESSEQPEQNWMSEEAVNELKHLIAQSTSMIDSYYEQIDHKLSGKYVLKSDFTEHTDAAEKSFAGLKDEYVSQLDFGTYKQSVKDNMDGLGAKFVSQTDFDARKEEVNANFNGLAETYVSSADFDLYKQEISAVILGMQESINDLTQRIDAMQETGGE